MSRPSDADIEQTELLLSLYPPDLTERAELLKAIAQALADARAAGYEEAYNEGFSDGEYAANESHEMNL